MPIIVILLVILFPVVLAGLMIFNNSSCTGVSPESSPKDAKAMRKEFKNHITDLQRRADNLNRALNAIYEKHPQLMEAQVMLRKDVARMRSIRFITPEELAKRTTEIRAEERKAKEPFIPLSNLAMFFNQWGWGARENLEKLPPGYRDALDLIISDGEKLLEALPGRSTKNMQNGQGDYIEGTPSWEDFQENGCYEPEVFLPWMEKVKELKQATENFSAGLRAMEISSLEKQGGEISKLNLSSSAIDFTSPMLLPVENSFLPEEEKVIQEVQSRMSELTLIESERAKRALSTIAEAQILRSEAEKVSANSSTTINGHSPEELVRAIIAGNVAELEEQVLHTSGAAIELRSPLDQLEVLRIYTEDKRAH